MTSPKLFDGRFKVQGPLRCTGVGSLICAKDTNGERIAIRLLPQHAQGSEAVAAVLNFPAHRALPRAISSGQQNDSSWIALDFPDGVLVTQQWPLELQRLVAMGEAVASALAALHQSNIVHGELSGDSVLVVPGDLERFVLFDAPLVVLGRMTDRRGEERLLAQLTQVVPFLAPERARGLEADFASDIWALGVLLSMAAGASAVPGASALEKIAAIVTGKWRPTVPVRLPHSLRTILTRMLAPEPKGRPSALEVSIEFSSLAHFAASNVDTDPEGNVMPAPTIPHHPENTAPAAEPEALLIPALPPRRRPQPRPPILDPLEFSKPSAAAPPSSAGPGIETTAEVRRVVAGSIHDQLEDAFADGLRRSRARRLLAGGVALGVLALTAAIFVALPKSPAPVALAAPEAIAAPEVLAAPVEIAAPAEVPVPEAAPAPVEPPSPVEDTLAPLVPVRAPAVRANAENPRSRAAHRSAARLDEDD